MKPTFALNITDDGFVLLHRTAKGWTSVGETAFSAPDLGEAMAYLRNTALGLVPKGVSTKLVIPNSQILYTEVEAPGPSDSSRRKQIKAALAGRTPYDVSDLVFDWSGKGPKLQVVAVAKDTLKEAEAFAVEHRLNPMSFVAIPEPGAFDGEPYFGMTAFAPGHLKAGETVERDPEPILPLSRSLPKPEPEVAQAAGPAPEPSDVAPNAAGPADPARAGPSDPAAAAGPPVLQTPAMTVAAPSVAAPVSVDAPTTDRPPSMPGAMVAPMDGPPAPAQAPQDVVFNGAPAPAPAMEPGRLAASLMPNSAVPDPVVTARAAESAAIPPQIVPEAPFAEVPETISSVDLDDVPDMPGDPLRGGLPDDVPPAPASSIRVAFASRRAAADSIAPPLSIPSSVVPVAASAVGRPSGGGIGTPPALGMPAPDPGRAPGLGRIVRDKPIEDLPPLQRPVFAAPKSPPASSARSAVAKSFGAVISAPGLSGSKKKAKVAPAASAAGGMPMASVMPSSSSPPIGAPRTLQPTKPLTKPGGTFGIPPKRNRPRYLGLVLTALLLVFLGLVAAWSSFYLSADIDARDGTDTAATAPEGAAISAPDAVAPEVSDALLATPAPAVEDEMIADGEFPEDVPAEPIVDGATGTDLTISTAGQDVGGDAGIDLDADAVAASVAAAVTANATPVAVAEITSEAAREPAAQAAGAPASEATAGIATDTDAPTIPEVADEIVSATTGVEASIAASIQPVAEPAPTEEVVAVPAPEFAPEPAAAPVAVAAAEPAAEPVPETVLAPAPETDIASDSPAAAALTEDQDEIFLAGTDTPPPALDALALPPPEQRGDPPPTAQAPPPPFGTVYQFDARGLIRPTPEGIMTPEGVMLFAGAPPLLPPARPQSVIEAAAASVDPAQALPAAAAGATLGSTVTPAEASPSLQVADPALSGFRPRARPDDLTPPSADDASTPVLSGTEVASLRPRQKPQTVISASETARQQSEAASLAAQAEAQNVAAFEAPNNPSNASLLAISRRPATRPEDFDRAVGAAVELAVAEAVRQPDPEPQPEAANPLPEDDQEPEVVSATRSVPLKGTVAKKATFVNALNLSRMNLIGVYGTDSKRYALVRQANGRFKKVRVGDRIDGGQVAAITASEMRYQKDGRLVSLKLPRG